MEDKLENIIREIGKEYELTEEELKQIIKKLRKHLYIKLKDIENIEEHFWNSLNLPNNLFHILKNRCNSALNSQYYFDLEQSQTLEELARQLSPTIYLELKNPENKIKENDSKIFKDLSELYSEINDNDNLIKVLKQIYRIITNIIKEPQDEKFKRFNINKLLEKYNYN